MRTRSGFARAGAVLGAAVVLVLSGCQLDERDVQLVPLAGNGGDTGQDGRTLMATGSPMEAAASLTPGASPSRESEPAPSATAAPTNVEVSLASDAADGTCVDGGTESCGPERQEGICRFGSRTCLGGVWGECTGAVLPTARDCSSAEDNDCDGQPDNAVDDVCRCPVGGTQACDEHPNLDGKGPCVAGRQACVAGADNQTSDWGPCEGAVGPATSDACEIPGNDADCDGSPNGGCNCVDGATVACGPDTDDGICQRGTSTCSGNAFGGCQGAVFSARRDCTSPLDNDCDGRPDSATDATCTCAVGATRACGTHPGRDGNGPCRAGTQTCVAGAQNGSSTFSACSGSVGPAQRDSCTVFGDDADCNGVANSGCQCVAGRGNQPCAGDPNNSRCNAQGQCSPCQSNADCSLVSGGRNLCQNGVCNAARCGDGIVQADRGETCDDGNTANGDGCSKLCVAGRAPRGGTSFASNHMCIVMPNGIVQCWGLNFAGQLGNGSTSAGTIAAGPGPVSLIPPALDVAIAGDTTCAALVNGTVSCWGAGFGARPVAVSGVAGVTQLAGGNGAFCGRQTAGTVTCWGTDAVVQQSQGLANITQIAQGDRHSCARRNDGVLLCSGGNSEGEGGQGALGDATVLPTAATVFSNVVEVATGYRSTCVRTTSSGNVQCVGTGVTAGSPTALPNANAQPVTVLNLGNAVKVVAGEQHMCALTGDDTVKCWGTGLAVGNGSTTGSITPVEVRLPVPAVDVGAGTFTSCALLSDSTVYCWGNFAGATSSATPRLLSL